MKPKKVLVIQNDGIDSRTYHQLFSSWNVGVAYASRLTDTYTNIESEHYDAVILDGRVCNNLHLKMFEAIDELSPYTSVIVVVDSLASEDDVRTFKLMGIDVLRKPILADDLFQTLMNALGKRTTREKQERRLVDIEQKFLAMKDQRAKMEHLEVLVSHMLTALPTIKTPQVDANGQNFAKVSKPWDFYKVRSMLGSLLKELRRDDAMKKYESEFALIDDCLENLGSDSENHCNMLKKLSFRELRIVSMIRNGMTTDQISESLYISPDTVKTHRRNIRKKLDIVGDKSDLASFLRLAGNSRDGSFAASQGERSEG